MTELESYIKSYFAVNNQELEIIRNLFKLQKLNKGEYYLKTGGRSNRLGFIRSGVMREYVSLEQKEVTKWISTPGYFVVDLASFVFNSPARWNIQALTDCELHVINEEDYAAISRQVPRWQELEKLFIAKCFTVLEDRVLQHLSLTAEERYERLFAFNKELFSTVPLHYLASMLGMTPETFSRIRKKMAH